MVRPVENETSKRPARLPPELRINRLPQPLWLDIKTNKSILVASSVLRRCSEVSQTARDASKATAEVACSCELCFYRLSRAVRSGYGAGSVGRAADAVGHEDLRVLSVR